VVCPRHRACYDAESEVAIAALMSSQSSAEVSQTRFLFDFMTFHVR
jgi:hypothetical protein